MWPIAMSRESVPCGCQQPPKSTANLSVAIMDSLGSVSATSRRFRARMDNLATSSATSAAAPLPLWLDTVVRWLTPLGWKFWSIMIRPLRRLTPPLWRRALAVQTFPVPEMGDSITEGTILEFGKKVGEHVALEEMVASIETDKVTVELRAPAAGTITKLFASIDDTVIVGTDFMEIDVGVGEASATAPAAAAASPASVAAPPPEAAASASLTGVYQFGRSMRNHPGGRKSLM